MGDHDLLASAPLVDQLDRTPLPHEPGGRVYGGYAGLSLRLVNLDDRAAVDLDDETLVERAHTDLARLIGVSGPPRECSLTRFRNAMPQFEVGYPERVRRLEREVEEHEGLYLAGSALGAYGLADCVASGEAVAAKICAGVASRESA